MLYPIKLYFKYLPNLITLSLSLLLNILLWIWLLWKINPGPDPVFLHYNILFGVDFIGEWWQVLFLPLAGLLIFLINGIIAWMLFSKDKFISLLLNAVSLLCQMIIFIAGALLVFLNV